MASRGHVVKSSSGKSDRPCSSEVLIRMNRTKNMSPESIDRLAFRSIVRSDARPKRYQSIHNSAASWYSALVTAVEYNYFIIFLSADSVHDGALFTNDPDSRYMQWRSSVCPFLSKLFLTTARCCGNCSSSQFSACRKYCMNECRAKGCPFRLALNERYMPNLSITASKARGALSRCMHCCRYSLVTSSCSRYFKNERAVFSRARFVLAGARSVRLILGGDIQAWILFVTYAIELPFFGDVGAWMLFLKYTNNLVFV